MVDRWTPSLTGNTGLQLPSTLGRNHGTLINFSNNGNNAYVASPDKLALDFDGTNDNVNCGTRVPRLGNGHTFAAWVFKRANGGMIAGMCDAISAGGIEWADQGGNFAFAFFDGSIRGWFVGPALPANQWSFVCAAFSNTSQRLVVNTTATTTSVSTSGIVYNNDAWRIGVAATGNPFWNGQIDDVTLWDRFLTDAEINTLYRLGRGGGMLREPPRRRSFFVPTLPLPVRRRSSRFLTFPG
jgi:hypothetical protein